MEPDTPYLTIGQAAELLGVDRRQIRRLIDRGQLEAAENPLDLRSKVVKREDVDRLKDYPRAAKKAAA